MSNVSNRLSNVARILENRFFYENNRVLAEELKRLKQEEESVDALAKASGIASKIVLTELVSLGVRPETVAALCLVPVHGEPRPGILGHEPPSFETQVTVEGQLAERLLFPSSKQRVETRAIEPERWSHDVAPVPARQPPAELPRPGRIPSAR